MASHPGLTRRTALALLLASCARVTHGELPEPHGARVTSAHRLRVVIFELAGADIPFHAGLVIHAGDTVLIYDPAGMWEPGPGMCGRDGEVIRDVTPAVEEAYLTRQGISYSVGGWVTHVFDVAVPPSVARLAIDRAEAADPVLPLHCAFAVSTLLHGLPGFADIPAQHITAELMQALLLRDDVTYTQRDLRPA